MKKHPGKTRNKRRRSATAKGVVDFVSFRTCRIKGDDGQRYSVRLDIGPWLMPGDRVSGKVVGSEGQKLLNPMTVSVEPCKDFQVVLQIERKMVGGREAETWRAISFAVHGTIHCTVDIPDLENGQHVLATLSRLQSHTPKGRVWDVISIDRVLNGSSQVACAVALTRFGIRDQFSIDLSKALSSISSQSGQLDLDARRDLRDLPFVTIDPATAKDHDDAVFCERKESGEFRLRVAIADVAHYVQPSMALDLAAQERGTSIYLPDLTVPMLPTELSNHQCSLKSGEDRLALVCDMSVGGDGQVSTYEFYEAAIRSHASLSYEDVEAGIQRGRWSAAVVDNINHLLEVHETFTLARNTRGALNLEIPEARLKFGASGQVKSVAKTARLVSHGLIEEAMLAANTCAAKFLTQHYPAAAMYRIHEHPAEDDLDEVNLLLYFFDLAYEFSPESTAADYQNVVNLLNSDHPRISAPLQLHLLRSMATAIYSPENRPHFALNYPEYTHFTSPIRRYPDLVVHRLIKQVLSGVVQPPATAELIRVAQLSSYRERRAESCAREAEQWLKAELMMTHVGEEFSGVIIDVKKFGIFVQLDSPYVDGMIHVSELGDEYFFYNDFVRTLAGDLSGRVFEIGQRLRVKVQGADPQLGHINFELVYSKKRKRRKKTG